MSVGSERSSAQTRLQFVLRVVQGLAGLWLLVQTVLLESGSSAADVKDVLAGSVLVAATLGAAVSGRVRRWEARVCLVVGVVLIVGAAVLAFGSGVDAAARQWSQVAVGVLLIWLWSATTS